MALVLDCVALLHMALSSETLGPLVALRRLLGVLGMCRIYLGCSGDSPFLCNAYDTFDMKNHFSSERYSIFRLVPMPSPHAVRHLDASF